jgi:single-stranded-DNA-specific exonuclease
MAILVSLKITADFAGQMALLAPFGSGNPRPVFEAHGVEVIDGPRRLKDRHLKMALKQNGGLRLDTAALAIKGADSGAVITPGDVDSSTLTFEPVI